MNFNKIIKSLLIIEFSLFLINASNYLMLLNTEFYKHYLFKLGNDESIISMFSFNWNLSNIIFYIMFLLAILIIILIVFKAIKKELS